MTFKSPAPPLLTVCAVTGMRHHRVLFKEINLTLNPAQILWIKGPNGSGKSTLLRMLIGLLPCPEGTIQWNNPSSFHYVGHQSGYCDHLTVFDNLRFSNIATEPSSEKIQKVLTHWGLSSYKNLLFKYLSMGQKRRLALARLSLQNSKVWLLDEPMENLDQKGVDLFNKAILEHHSHGGSIVLSSHLPLETKKTLSLEVLDLGHPS